MATASPFPFARAFLISIWIQTMLYGLNCAVFGTTLYVLNRRLRQKKKSSQEHPTIFLIPVSIFLFSLSTGYLVVSFIQLLEAFIYGEPGTADAYFQKETKPLAITKLILYSINVTSQNLFLIWRLWGVWNRNIWVVVFPLCLELVHTICEFIAIGNGARTTQARVPGAFILLIRQMSIVNWSMDLTINVGVTAAIAFRLWQMARFLGPDAPSQKQFYGVMRMILESGLLFATATLVTVSIYLSGSLATTNAIDAIVQLATITPLLIIVRVGLGLTAGQQRSTEVESMPTKIEFISRSRIPQSSHDNTDSMTHHGSYGNESNIVGLGNIKISETDTRKGEDEVV